jgi:hypothetical protein
VELIKWRQELSALGGINPLISFEASSFGQVDLTRAHPGGLAQLVSARTTTVTNLVRDGVAQSRSLSATRRIRTKAKRIRESFGLESCFIAGGLVIHHSTERKMPILLWPTSLIPKGDDYEVRIGGDAILNPVLVQLIREHRPDFRESDLLAVALTGPDLIPVAVLSLVAELLATPDTEIEKQLVLGNFVPDLSLIPKSAEGVGFLKVIAEKPALSPLSDQAPMAIANADSRQLEVIQRALKGESFAVETLPGTGYIQTVINLLGNLAACGKRTLIVAPREQTIDELSERLSQLGLGGLAIRNTDVWADAVAAISRNEKASEPASAAASAELSQSTKDVEEYFESVQAVDATLGLSLTQVLTRLAELSALAEAPVNSARIRPELLLGLRDNGEELIANAHAAGVFRFGPQHTPWFGARFSSATEIANAVRAAKELAGEEFRTLSYQINRYLADQKLKPCNSVSEWSAQLLLLMGIRETLDRFLPSIYDRSLAEMISATAPRGERGDLSGAQRRRFKKLAKGYIRPGSQVPNLHQALVAAEGQRSLWLELNLTQAPPTVPLGLNDVKSKFDQIYQALDLMQKHLDPSPDLELLTRMSFEELAPQLTKLAEQTEILDELLEREPVLRGLQGEGLADLALELCRISPSQTRAQQEFELCWWQSALEAIVAANPEILDFTAERIAEIEARFERAADAAIVQSLKSLQHLLAQSWKQAIQKHPAQADELRNQLRSRKLTLKSAKRAGAAWSALAPAVICSPLRVHEVGQESFDVLLILDAASTGVAEAMAAMQLAEQVIGFGDPVISAPENFDTVARANQGYVDSDRESVFSLLSGHSATMAITNSYRIEGQVLGQYLNSNFYQNRLELEPSSASLFGTSNFEHIEIKEDAKASSTIEGATESLDAEVSKVVELVLNHARWSPAQSLMVVTPSRTHAERVATGVTQAVLQQPQLAEFFDAHGREKFEVLMMSEIVHRIADRVIFSVGFGRTPEGRISGSLGDFNSPNAARWMVNQIASARKRLTVVSCYNFEDFAGGSLPENQRWLKDLIAPSFLSEARSGEPDPLLKDLSLRLQKLGLKVELNFAGRIALAVSFGQRAAVVDPDWSLTGDSWDEKLRLRPGLLRAMGWEYLRVHALEIFARPQDVANRIASQLGVEVEKKKQPLFEDKAFEDTSRAWGDPDDSNDQRLRDDKPPHWG